MLVLAVHNLTETSAKIPFAMVVLLDCISKKLHPVQLKCRQVGALSRANCPPHERPRQQLRSQAAPHQISYAGKACFSTALSLQIVPTSGLRSVSVWEAPDAESLREWCAAACLKRNFAKHDLQIFHAGP